MKRIVLLLVTAVWGFAMEPLVSAAWLKAHLHDKDLVIVDASSHKLYAKGHIPGAVQSGIGKWRKREGKHALVRDMAEIEKEMRRLGISKDSKVVVYSHHSNAKDTLKPTYLLWAMERYGFDRTALLDGGLEAWKRAGGEVSAAEPAAKGGDVALHPVDGLVAGLKDVQAALHSVRMLDARPAIFYFGARKQPVLKRSGHIPGATSYFWKYSFNDDGTLKPLETIREMVVGGLGLDPEAPVITYCTGGLETSMNFFVLHRLLGFKKARLYDVSMKEWANREDTPMVRYRWE
ncbi:sulfurtransferase [Hydrogenimonas sp.]